MANSYAPNVDDLMFFANLECTLTDMGSYPIIWAEEMSIVKDAILDRGVPSKTRLPKSLLTIEKLCCALGLVDVWRLLNPAGMNYTFFFFFFKPWMVF